MLQMQSVLVVADNSGAKRVRVIKILGGTHRRYAFVGDTIVVSVIDAIPNGKVKKGEIYRALVVRSKYPITRKDKSMVRFEDNAVVLVDKKSLEPIGTRVTGPVARECDNKKMMSLASEVL